MLWPNPLSHALFLCAYFYALGYIQCIFMYLCGLKGQQYITAKESFLSRRKYMLNNFVRI